MSNADLRTLDNKYKSTKAFNSIYTPVSWILVGLFFLLFLFFCLLKSQLTIGLIMLAIAFLFMISYFVVNSISKKAYKSCYYAMYKSIIQQLGGFAWMLLEKNDDSIAVKSSQAVNTMDDVKFFKEDTKRLSEAVRIMKLKDKYSEAVKNFLSRNEYAGYEIYKQFETRIEILDGLLKNYYVTVNYTSPAGRKSVTNTLVISLKRIKELATDKSILMTKSEYNKYVKERGKELLEEKQHSYYERVNEIIDAANNNKDSLVIKGEVDELDRLIASLFDRTVNSIKKIKSVESEEWTVIDNFISGIEDDVRKIVDKNQQILDYYQSEDFQKIKTTCDTLMDSQREFNEYIDEKVKAISSLFGTAISRNETVNEDEYNYIHPYKKSITPFTAEVSATVFASAENNPLDYVVKYFYSNKERYPEQIQKLQTLIEELETLKEAKEIIEKYKSDIQQYLTEVPSFIKENDEDGFYARLGFATINESTLVVAYKFSYTSIGGKAQRYFTIPMTEETIVELINLLESKLTMSAFTREQRSLMTNKLRQQIKERDNFTCKFCGNSTHTEPNLLLEIDHIIPVAKGGITEESNLQTLCWKCNRAKSCKLM